MRRMRMRSADGRTTRSMRIRPTQEDASVHTAHTDTRFFFFEEKEKKKNTEREIERKNTT
jgi:hypothetical protein